MAITDAETIRFLSETLPLILLIGLSVYWSLRICFWVMNETR